MELPANCSSVSVSVLNEVVAKNKTLCYFIKVDKRLSDIQKVLVFGTLTVLEIAVERILPQNESRLRNLWKAMIHPDDSVSLMGSVHKQISSERKERLNTS